MVNISAVIITFNEEERIGRCIDSIRNSVDEILVVDSFSTDNTEIICKQKGVRFIQNKFQGFTSQKTFAVQQAYNDIILSLDADEYLSDELIQSIADVKANFACDGYSMNRLNSYAGRWIKSCGWYPDNKIRLWNRKKGAWQGELLHEIVVMQLGSNVGRLKGDLLHEAYKNAAQLLKKMQQYSDFYALQHKYKKKISAFGIVIKTIAAFFQNYILKHGFLDGYEGLVISASNANGVFYKYAKLFEVNRSLTASLIITTYNRPDALELVLLSIINQSVLPDEVIIADDGSTNATRDLVESYSKTFPTLIHHVWQEDLGFRAASIRNKAMALAKHDYIIFIDGDLILHRDFVKDHKLNARTGYFIQGSRVLLKEHLTKGVLASRRVHFSFFSNGIVNRKNTIHSRLLSRITSYTNVNIYNVRSVNLSFWKKDAEKINGFNEDFIGWGREDSEFALRMQNIGLKRLHLKFLATGYHLYHPESSREMLLQNQKILDDAMQNKSIICVNGIIKYSRNELGEQR